MLPTKIDIPLKIRESLVAILTDRLADSLDLAAQAKQAHWNIKGPAFTSLHKLFDDVAASAQSYADLIAERIVQLGGTALGTIQHTVAASTLLAYPINAISQDDHVNLLSSALAVYSMNLRNTIEFATYLKDQVTADILIEVTRGSDKWLWMVEAHLVK